MLVMIPSFLILLLIVTVAHGARSSGGSSRPRVGGYSGGGRSSSLASLSGGPSGGLNGGLGNKYRSNTAFSGQSLPTAGRCCNYLCCTAGFYPGYSMFWYYGYRPTREESDEFTKEFVEAEMAVRTLKEDLSSTADTIYTGDCALVRDENNFLVNRTAMVSDSIIAANFTNATLREELSYFHSRVNVITSQLGDEVDLRTEIMDWFLDFNALQPCLETLRNVSEENESLIMSTRSEIEQAEAVASSWEFRIQSSGPSFVGMGSFAAAMALSVFLM